MNDPRNLAIAVLSAAVLGLGAALLWSGSGGPGPEPPAGGEEAALVDREPVSVLDLVLDRETLRQVDLIFDRPLGADATGEALARDPATLSPRVGGVWTWAAANVLRFTPTSRLPSATRYEIRLVPERLLGEDQVLVGESRVVFETDPFQVERVDVHEEPDPEGGGRVTLRGQIRFNYAVEPRELAHRLRLADPAAAGAPVEVELESSYQSTVVGWHSASVEKESRERELLFTILSDLTAAEGNLPLGTDYTRTIRLGSRERLAVRAVSARSGEKRSTIEIELSSLVEADIAADYLEVEPRVDFQLGAERNRLLLRGAFRPGEAYDVALAAGLPASDDAVLAERFERRVELPHLDPSADFQSAGMFLSGRGAHRVAIETVNVDRIRLSIDRVYRNNVLYLVQQRGYQVWRERGSPSIEHVFGDRVVETDLDIRGRPDRSTVTAVDLDDHVDLTEPGFYRVGLQRPGTYGLTQRWLLVTDLGLVVKIGSRDALVWASSFATLEPLVGVTVQLVSDQNQVIASGRTDDRGLLRFEGLDEAFERSRPAYAVASRGSDWSFVPLDQARIDTSGLDVGGAGAPGSGYDAYLYGERDLYRPGETARGVAVLRDRRLGTPPAMPALLRHQDPEGQPRRTQRIDFDAAGVAEWTQPIAEAARTGTHSLELVVGEEVVGRYRFQIEEFVPDRIEVGIDPPAEPAGPGDTLAYAVEAAYLFGPPAAGLPVETRVRLEPAAFVPPGHPGFAFGNPDRSFSAREILFREGALDEAGRASFEVGLPTGVEPPGSLAAVVRARVREQGGRGVAAQLRVPVHPHPRYVGLRRTAEGYAEPGQPVAFEWVSVAPDGSDAPGARLRAELYRLEWQTVLRRTPSGSYRYDSERDARLVDSRALEPAAAGGAFEFTPDDWGSYQVVVTDLEGGGSAALRFTASGWGYAPWSMEDPGRVELDVERDDFAPGERALVQVRTPFPGRLLLCVEREGVLHAELHTLEGNTATIPVSLREAYRPNVYVTATLVRSARDLEPGAAARAYGAVPVNVDRLRHRMRVEIDAAEEVRSNGSLEVAVRALPGARLTVAAVDEGVLQLVGQETPDPFAHFYRKRALLVTAHDIFSLLLPELAVEGGAAAGGGRADAARELLLRTEGIRRAEPVAFWSGVLEADASGAARASFDLPDFQGALRVMAVAHRGSDFGAATAFTRARDPLVLQPTFPRFLAPGDRVELPVTARNDTGSDASFQLSVEASGPASVGGPGSRSVRVDDASETTVYFPIEAGSATGDLRLAVRAEGAGQSARASTELGVRPDLPPRVVEDAGVIDASGTTTLVGDGGGLLRPEGRHRSLRVGRTPLVELHGALAPLVQYPYGCLEQTVSRAFPLLHLADLARELEPELFEEQDPDAMVADAVRWVGSLQLSGGGFALWPRGSVASPWASLYAAHFLVEAQRAGHAVPDFVAEGALRYARGEAIAKPRYSGPELERTVYALYVLARAGEPDLATMDFVREKHEARLAASSRALLGAAYASTGNLEALEELAAAVSDAEQVRRQSGGNFASTARNRALLLLGLLDAAPDDPRIPSLARRIARDARTSRWNTQEAATSLLALGQLFARAGASPVRGRVRVGGAEVAGFEGSAAVFRDLPPEGDVEIELEPGAGGTVYYALSVRGTPTDEAFSGASEGIEVERVLLDREGAPLDDGRVHQGDLVVARVRVRSTAGPLENVVVMQLLPAGAEVENPRLEAAESLPWARDADLPTDYVDVRDDRVLLFAGLPDAKWRTSYTLLRAVAPGRFRLPAVHVEAMYEPTLRAVGGLRGFLEVERRP